jgi:hypothetical protein
VDVFLKGLCDLVDINKAALIGHDLAKDEHLVS